MSPPKPVEADQLQAKRLAQFLETPDNALLAIFNFGHASLQVAAARCYVLLQATQSCRRSSKPLRPCSLKQVLASSYRSRYVHLKPLLHLHALPVAFSHNLKVLHKDQESKETLADPAASVLMPRCQVCMTQLTEKTNFF